MVANIIVIFIIIFCTLGSIDQLERLELVLGGCVGKCAKNGDRIVAQNQQ